jgi:hypothetical protein
LDPVETFQAAGAFTSVRAHCCDQSGSLGTTVAGGVVRVRMTPVALDSRR